MKGGIQMKVSMNGRWPEQHLIREARMRTKKLINSQSAEVQRMLAALLQEAKWSEAEFIEALVRDVARQDR